MGDAGRLANSPVERLRVSQKGLLIIVPHELRRPTSTFALLAAVA